MQGLFVPPPAPPDPVPLVAALSPQAQRNAARPSGSKVPNATIEFPIIMCPLLRSADPGTSRGRLSIEGHVGDRGKRGVFANLGAIVEFELVVLLGSEKIVAEEAKPMALRIDEDAVAIRGPSNREAATVPTESQRTPENDPTKKDAETIEPLGPRNDEVGDSVNESATDVPDADARRPKGNEEIDRETSAADSEAVDSRGIET